MQNGLTKIPFDRFFELKNNHHTRGHALKLVKKRCRTDLRQLFFDCVINRWNNLSIEAIESTSLNAFKKKMNLLRKTRKGLFRDWEVTSSNDLMAYSFSGWRSQAWWDAWCEYKFVVWIYCSFMQDMDIEDIIHYWWWWWELQVRLAYAALLSLDSHGLYECHTLDVTIKKPKPYVTDRGNQPACLSPSNVSDEVFIYTRQPRVQLLIGFIGS